MAKRRVILNEDQIPDFGGGSPSILTLSASGTTDNLDMTGFNFLKIDCSAGNIVLGGILAKAEGEIIHIFRAVTGNSFTIQNESISSSAIGNRFFLLPKSSKLIFLYSIESFVYTSGFWIPLGFPSIFDQNSSPENITSAELEGYIFITASGSSGPKTVLTKPNLFTTASGVSGTTNTFNSIGFTETGSVISVAYSGAVTINGISDFLTLFGVGKWKEIIIANTGTGTITVNHENAGAVANARFNLIGGTPVTIEAGRFARFIYFQNRFRN
jgi:hypothetical protein